jgi:hypothetical protein
MKQEGTAVSTRQLQTPSSNIAGNYTGSFVVETW